MNRLHLFHPAAVAGVVALIGISLSGASTVLAADAYYVDSVDAPTIIARHLTGHPPYKRGLTTAHKREKGEFAQLEEVTKDAARRGVYHRHLQGRPPYKRHLGPAHNRGRGEFARFEETSEGSVVPGVHRPYLKGHPPYRRHLRTTDR